MTTRLRTAYRGPEAPIGFVHGEPVYPIAGSRRSGTHTAGDVLVNQTADGVSLTTVWNEFVETLRMYNEHRLAIMRLLAFPTTVSLDVVQQAVSGARFELASEFGEPVGMRPAPDTLLIGYSRGDYDLAVRYTWRFLRDAPTQDQTIALTRSVRSNTLTAAQRDQVTVVLTMIGAAMRVAAEAAPGG